MLLTWTTNPAPFDGIVQHLNNILAHHAFTVEALCPGGKNGFIQTLLDAGKGKCEAKRQFLALKFVIHHELVYTVCDVIKELQKA